MVIIYRTNRHPPIAQEGKWRCQEQIELSGLLARELSAFLFHRRSVFLEQAEGGGRSLPQIEGSYPHPHSRSFCRARREGAVGNSLKPLFSSV
jgi:hypothetical protein